MFQIPQNNTMVTRGVHCDRITAVTECENVGPVEVGKHPEEGK